MFSCCGSELQAPRRNVKGILLAPRRNFTLTRSTARIEIRGETEKETFRPFNGRRWFLAFRASRANAHYEVSFRITRSLSYLLLVALSAVSKLYCHRRSPPRPQSPLPTFLWWRYICYVFQAVPRAPRRPATTTTQKDEKGCTFLPRRFQQSIARLIRSRPSSNSARDALRSSGGKVDTETGECGDTIMKKRGGEGAPWSKRNIWKSCVFCSQNDIASETIAALMCVCVCLKGVKHLWETAVILRVK